MDFSFASLLSDPEERENSAEYHDHRASTKPVPPPPLPPLHCCPCGPTHRPVRAPLHFISMEIETAASQKIGKGKEGGGKGGSNM